MKSILHIIAICFALATIGCASSGSRPGEMPRGAALDHESRQVTSIPRGSEILIREFSTEEVDLGTAENNSNEKRNEAAQIMKRTAPALLASKIRTTLERQHALKPLPEGADSCNADSCMVLEGRFVMINPGSRAKRYWVGLGAGKSGVTVKGRLLGRGGEVLLEFEHTRHSGIGFYGGDYIKFLTDDVYDVGEDIAELLVTMAR